MSVMFCIDIAVYTVICKS